MMNKVVGLLASFVVFVAWMRIVGNPHVVETVIGLIISLFIGFWVASKVK